MLVGMGWLYIIIVGLIAGWATGKIMKGSGYGLLADILLGIVGAIIGSRILGLVGIYSSGGLVPNILVAIVGAVILVAIVRAIKKA
ncbi:MAG: GlsB/YeaQ/YmgE family stress response membrane protein [Terriglobales bacterium]